MSVNAASVGPSEALEIPTAGWRAQMSGTLTTSWMRHGKSGAGKTEIVQALATRHGARRHDLRLSTIEPQDLRGLPCCDHETSRTVWFPPEDLPGGDTPAILFLHGLTALVYALAARATEATLGHTLKILADIRVLRSDTQRALPLAGLVGFGFEVLIREAFENDWQEAFARLPAYADYMADWQRLGLA